MKKRDCYWPYRKKTYSNNKNVCKSQGKLMKPSVCGQQIGGRLCSTEDRATFISLRVRGEAACESPGLVSN